MKACSQEGVLDILVQALKEHEAFRVFTKSCVAPVAERITAGNSGNTQPAVISADRGIRTFRPRQHVNWTIVETTLQ